MRVKRNLALLALCLSVASSLSAANLKAMVRALNGAYDGQIVTLRRFSSGSKLDYAQNGDFVKGGKVGPWTLDAYLQINKMRMNRNRLRIDGDRLDFMYDKAIKDLRPYRGPAVSIDITIDPVSASLTNFQNVFSKVFVSERASMADLAPDYWRPYLLETVPYKRILTSVCGNGGAPTMLSASKVTLPKRKYAPEPLYPPEEREEGIQGQVLLCTLVGTDGTVKRVTILQPLGMGLDDEAVETIERWKFSPATLRGQPVADRLVLKVTFDLGGAHSLWLWRIAPPVARGGTQTASRRMTRTNRRRPTP